MSGTALELRKATAELVALSTAVQQLANIEDVGPVKDVASRAAAVRAYYEKIKGPIEAQNRAAVIEVLAYRRAGTLVQAMRAAGKIRGKCDPTAQSDRLSLQEVIGAKTADLAYKFGVRCSALLSLPEAKIAIHEQEANKVGVALTVTSFFKEAKRTTGKKPEE